MSEETQITDDKESLARAHLPYRAEYCKTGRAKCKKCSESMEANSLKLAILTKSRFHDGYDANFYHAPCFFQMKRPTSVAEIRNFETLKYNDQKMLEDAIETKGLSILGDKVIVQVDNGATKGKSKKVKKRPTEETDTGLLVNYDDFMVEYAKSGRAKCYICEEKIDKDSVRLGKLDYQSENQWTNGPVPRWNHVECFVKSMDKLEFFGQIEKLKDFDRLEDDDQKMLKEKVDAFRSESGENGKKIKKEEKEPINMEEEKLLKKQSDRYFKLREFVDTIKKKDIQSMLEHMEQKSDFKSPSQLIDMATDVLLFGPLEKCPICKKRGGIILRGSSYICTKGSGSEPCSYETRDPKRGLPDVPEEIEDKYSFLTEDYKFRGGKRIFPTKFVKAIEQKEAEQNNIALEGAPLDGLAFGVISWKGIQADKIKVQKKITTLGGKIRTALDKTIFVILSSEDQLIRDEPKVEVAKSLNVPFATPDFLFRVKTKEDIVSRVKECLIGEWDGDIEARLNEVKQLD